MTEDHLHTEENNGFKVPGDYFGQARSRLFHQVEQGGFVTPDGYFEEARERLLKATIQQKPARVIVLKRNWFAVAAAAIIVSGGLWFLYGGERGVTDNAQVSNEEIINYVVASGTLNDIPLNELYTGDLVTVTHEDEEIVNQLDEDILLNEL